MSSANLPNFKLIDSLSPRVSSNENSYSDPYQNSVNSYVPPQSRENVHYSTFGQDARQTESHNYPMEEHGMPQISHTMKRRGDNHKLSEIFGNQQNFSRMDEIEIKTASGARIPQNYSKEEDYSQYTTFSNSRATQPINFINTTDPKETIYRAISEYFKGFTMTKVQVFGKYSVYKAVATCLLCDGGVRFVVAIVLNDSNQLGFKTPLSSLKWESFQTRYQQDDKEVGMFKLNSFSYHRPQQTILNDKIKIRSQHSHSNLYTCDTLNLQIEVLKEKEDEYFADHGTVAGALELFSTILTFA